MILKTYLTGDRVLLLSIIVLLLFLFTCHSPHKPQAKVTGQDSVTYWRDKLGNEHAKVLVLATEKSALYDSIAKILRIKPKEVIRYVSTGVRIDTLLMARVDTLVKVDTVTGSSSTSYVLDYTDSSYLRLHAVVPSSPQVISLSLNANVSFADYWERSHHFLGMGFGKKIYSTSVSTDNPYVLFTGLTSLKRNERSRLELHPGIGIGLNYNPFTKSFAPGVQAGLFIIRTK